MKSLRTGWSPVILSFALLACDNEDVTNPELDSTLTITPAVQWAGGAVTVAGDALSAGGEAIFVNGVPADFQRVGDRSVVLTLPNPLASGQVELSVEIEGVRAASGLVDVVGFAWPARTVGCALGGCSIARLEASSPITYHGVAAGANQFLAFFITAGGGTVGIANLDGPSPEMTPVSGLSSDELPGLTAPGPAADPRRWILDVSVPGVATQPESWSISPNPGDAQPLPCLPAGVVGGYSVAELATGDCLVLGHASPGESAPLSINGMASIAGYDAIPAEWGAGCVAFRSAPGGARTTLRSLRGSFFCESSPVASPPVWPVFGSGGTLAFSSPRYPEWPRGAAFSSTGDTLWTVGESTGWTLDAWDATTGELLAEIPLPGFARCEDVLVDALGSRIYVACRREEVLEGGWPSLVVVDAPMAAVLAVLDTDPDIGLPALPPFELVSGGSSGRVHLVAVFDGTSAPQDRGVLVASFDTF